MNILKIYIYMKKGQAVSLFLVVGVILLISFGVFLYLRTAVTRQPSDVSTNFETQKVQLATQIQDCLRTQTKEGVGLYGLNYWSSEDEIKYYIENNLDECIPFEAFEKQGLRIEKEDIETNATITDNYLEIKVKYPITMSSKISSAEIENFIYDMEISKEKFMPNDNGIVTQDTIIELKDAGIKLEIPKGTLMLDMSNIEKGKEIPRVDKVSIRVKGKNIIRDHFDTGISNKLYDLKPDDTWFYPAVKLSLGYDEITLPESTKEDDLRIVYFNNYLGKWIELETQVDKKNNILTTYVNHFSTYAIKIAEEAGSFASVGSEKEFCNNLYEDLMINRDACVGAIFREVGSGGDTFFKKTGIAQNLGTNMISCTAIYFREGVLDISWWQKILKKIPTTWMITSIVDRIRTIATVVNICIDGGHSITYGVWSKSDDVDKYKGGTTTVAMGGCIDYLKGKKDKEGIMYEMAVAAKNQCYTTLGQYEDKQIVKCPGKDYVCDSLGNQYLEDSGCEVFVTEEEIEEECGAIVTPEEEVGENRKNIDEFRVKDEDKEPFRSSGEDVMERLLGSHGFDSDRCNELIGWCNEKLDIEKDAGVVIELWEGEDAQCPPLDEEGNEVPLPEGVSCYGEKCTEYDLLYETEQCYQFSTTDPSTQICPEGTQLRPYHCTGDSSVRCCVRDEVINFYSGGGITTIIEVSSEEALLDEIATVLADSANLETWGCEDLESLKIYVSRINSIYASIYYTSKLEGSTELSGKLIEANNQLIECIGEEAAEEIIDEAKEEAETEEEEVVEETECCCVAQFWIDNADEDGMLSYGCYPESCEDKDICSNNVADNADSNIFMDVPCSKIAKNVLPCDT